MILDATAGNRKFWKTKEHEYIVYVDWQLKLEYAPTIYADNRKLPFQPHKFDTVIYDPPHLWNYHSIFFGFPDKATLQKNQPNDHRQYPTYYGMEQYDSKSALMKSIFLALREFHRILKPDGLLWFNWSEMGLSLARILILFRDQWRELIRLHIQSIHQQLSECKNYWVCFAPTSSSQLILM